MFEIPKPAFYTSWQAWAQQLSLYLKRSEESRVAEARGQLPTYFATGLPSAAQPGILIWVTDEAKVGVSTSTGWKRLSFAT